MCDTVVSNDPSLIVQCLDKYITQKMCDKAVYKDPFLTAYCPDKYITQKRVMKLLMILQQYSNLFPVGLFQAK